jgi:hypothetical protein
MQRHREICSHPPMAQAPCLSSRSAPFNMQSTRRKCGADEGQMREIIGYIVARRGAEEASVRTDAFAPQRHEQFLCKPLLRKDRADDALNDDESIGARTDSARTGSPITIIYAREIYTGAAVDEIAAIPGFGVFD